MKHPFYRTIRPCVEPGNDRFWRTRKSQLPIYFRIFTLTPDWLLLWYTYLLGLVFCLPTPLAPITRHQLPLLHIKPLLGLHFPLVVPVAAQGIALVFFFQGFLLERQDIGHGVMLPPGGHQGTLSTAAVFHYIDAMNPIRTENPA